MQTEYPAISCSYADACSTIPIPMKKTGHRRAARTEKRESNTDHREQKRTHTDVDDRL